MQLLVTEFGSGTGGRVHHRPLRPTSTHRCPRPPPRLSPTPTLVSTTNPSSNTRWPATDRLRSLGQPSARRNTPRSSTSCWERRALPMTHSPTSTRTPCRAPPRRTRPSRLRRRRHTSRPSSWRLLHLHLLPLHLHLHLHLHLRLDLHLQLPRHRRRRRRRHRSSPKTVRRRLLRSTRRLRTGRGDHRSRAAATFLVAGVHDPRSRPRWSGSGAVAAPAPAAGTAPSAATGADTGC